MTGNRRQPTPGHGPGRHGGQDARAMLEQDFDAGSLYVLRSAVSAHAAAAGLPPDQVYDVVVVAHELAANAVLHGAGRGRLRLDAADGTLTCQVSDAGTAAADTDGKRGAASALPWPTEQGHGLWVARQAADKFTIDHGPSGTTATATFAIRPPQ